MTENTRLSAIAERYDLILCDVWGVIHNGVRATPGVADALTRFREKGGAVVLITNAPRPAWSVKAMLDRLNVPDTVSDAIVSSGDVTRALLREREGQRMFHLGPGRDISLYEDLTFVEAGKDDADFVLCTGLYDDTTETPDDYRAMFDTLLARKTPMLCANPDVVVERGDTLVYCAGALADLYEDMGGEVLTVGKPHGTIYDAAIATGEAALGGKSVDVSRVLAIGDSVRTDLNGAAGKGIDVLFITDGIHAAENDALEKLFNDAKARPVGTAVSLAW
ncbi:MAG: TIGR01459 family HAD-type hydrolase [Pseudomonadota bacterium]